MIYGLQNNIFEAPYSLIVSILIFLGIFYVGHLAIIFFLKLLSFKYKEKYYLFSPLIGTYIVIYVIYILINIGFGHKNLFTIFSFTLFVLGLINILFFFNKINYFISKLKDDPKNIYIFVIIIYIGLLLVSLSPITHADSLDYHVSGAIDLFHKGNFHQELLPMHNHLVSIGEIILALGFALKAEQLGGLVQYSSLLSLIPIFTGNKKKNILILLLILCTPVTLFLVSSPKPQLLYSISTLLIFFLLINYFEKIEKNKLKIIFPLLILILAINGLVKHSFLLSSALLGFYSLYLMGKKKLLIFSLFSILVVFFITFFPNWYSKYNTYGTEIWNLILSPLPINIYGFGKAHHLLVGGNIQILEIFVPFRWQDFSHTYGPAFLISFFLINRKILDYKIPFLLIILFFFNVLVFGSNLPRFLFEGYLWFLFLISKTTYDYKNLSFKTFNLTILLQSFAIFLVILFYVFLIFPGSLSISIRDKVMSNNADGYSASKWVNQNLSQQNVLISTHRSISLFNNETYSSIFTWFIDEENKNSEVYFNFLKNKNIDRIFFYGNKIETKPFSRCLGKLLFYKENIGRKVGRNPFTKSDSYNGWIYEFKSKNLPECLF